MGWVRHRVRARARVRVRVRARVRVRVGVGVRVISGEATNYPYLPGPRGLRRAAAAG